jgi:hypothetical protein
MKEIQKVNLSWTSLYLEYIMDRSVGLRPIPSLYLSVIVTVEYLVAVEPKLNLLSVPGQCERCVTIFWCMWLGATLLWTFAHTTTSSTWYISLWSAQRLTQLLWVFHPRNKKLRTLSKDYFDKYKITRDSTLPSLGLRMIMGYGEQVLTISVDRSALWDLILSG